MKNYQYLVSVITPVYNSQKFIKRTVTCVANQNINLEHIIVDDGSTDESPSIIKKLASSNNFINAVFLKSNMGPIHARNIAISLAKGRFIAFLDADDVWLPNKLKIQIEFMISRQLSFTYTDYRFLSQDGLSVGKLVKGPDLINFNKHLASRSGLGCLTIVIDMEVIREIEFIKYTPEINKAEDFILWAKILKSHTAHRVPYDLARYSVIDGSRSSNIISKAIAIYKIYFYIFGLRGFNLIHNYLSFILSATTKRFFCRPNMPVTKVDKCIGTNWIEMLKIDIDTPLKK